MARATRNLAAAVKSGRMKESEVETNETINEGNYFQTSGIVPLKRLRKTIEMFLPCLLLTTQVTVERLESMLYTAPSPPVDLMIRTSGEKRLSDFLLWQSDNAIIHFTSVLWPEFSLWHLLAAVFYYQVCHWSN